MTEAKFTSEMLSLLSSIKGSTFVSYTLCPFEFSRGHQYVTYAKVRLNFDVCSIELLNQYTALPTGEYAVFECEAVAPDSKFMPLIANTDVKDIRVDAIVNNVEIINDTVCIKERTNITTEMFDVALVIKTSANVYTFSKHLFLFEDINVDINRCFDDIYPLENVCEDWGYEDQPDTKFNVHRTVIEL